MVSAKYLAIVGFALGAWAQAQFGAAENSGTILGALEAIDAQTITSGQAAAAFTGNKKTTNALVNQNVFLLGQWQNLTFQAQSSLGFYSDEGAQAIIDYVTNVLYPDQKAADQIYIRKRNNFAATGFIGYINPGLLKLRSAVDAASAAVQAKTRANRLTNMTVAFTLLEQDYADTQEIQQFGALSPS